MPKVSRSENNGIAFTAESIKMKLFRKPIEDAFFLDKLKRFAIAADGVTRDWDEHVNKLFLPFFYERPSKAGMAAFIAVNSATSALMDFQEKNEKAIRLSIEHANTKVGELARKLNITPKTVDYLKNDYPATTIAIASKRDNGYLSYGFMADSGIALFDDFGNMKFKTNDEGPNTLVFKERVWTSDSLKDKNWKMPEARKIIRSKYRNNPMEPISYGVLTGERTALDYLKTGTIQTRKGDTLVVFTDGLESVLNSGEFALKIKEKDYESIREICSQKVKTEGSLILIPV